MQQKYSYIVELEESLATSREMLELLKNRVKILKTKEYHSDKDRYISPKLYTDPEFEKNEDRITIIETEGKIKSLQKIIDEKQQYFEKFAAQFDIDRAEMEKNWLETFDRAQKKRKYIPALEHFMANADWDKCNNFIESKVHAYKRMKELLKLGQ